MNDDVNLEVVNKLANAVAEGTRDSILEDLPKVALQLSGVPVAVVRMTVLNGMIAGVLHAVSDLADEGELSDPDEKVTLMFRIAADMWTQIRGGPAGTAGGVQ